MKLLIGLLTALALTLLAALGARGQSAPTTAPAPWQLSNGGKSLQVKAKCTTAELDAVCKAHSGDLTTILFDWSNESIDSFAPLAQVKGLKTLHMMSLKASQKQPLDLAPLAGLTDLEDLDLYGTHVKNTAALAGLKKIKSLSFYMSNVDAIDCVASMENLETLSLYGFEHTFKDYRPLVGLKKLKDLNVYMNKQATDPLLAPLAALASLESIHMANDSSITTLAFLKGSKGMKTISANWCRGLKDISALEGMDQIEALELDDTPISDIGVLAGKAHLRTLAIPGTKVTDLTPLAKCGELQMLNIAKTPVKDLSPLTACTKLTQLQVPDTVPQDQIDALKKALPKLRVEVQK